MTSNRIFADKPRPQPIESKEREIKMNRRNVSLIVGTAILVAAVTVAVRVAANNGAVEALSPASAPPIAYHDLNDLKLYRASEWGLPVPEEALAAWHDLDSLTLYRASEWGTQADTLTSERLYHQLMLVK
jgi:hypothetical protein